MIGDSTNTDLLNNCLADSEWLAEMFDKFRHLLIEVDNSVVAYTSMTVLDFLDTSVATTTATATTLDDQIDHTLVAHTASDMVDQTSHQMPTHSSNSSQNILSLQSSDQIMEVEVEETAHSTNESMEETTSDQNTDENKTHGLIVLKKSL